MSAISHVRSGRNLFSGGVGLTSVLGKGREASHCESRFFNLHAQSERSATPCQQSLTTIETVSLPSECGEQRCTNQRRQSRRSRRSGAPLNPCLGRVLRASWARLGLVWGLCWPSCASWPLLVPSWGSLGSFVGRRAHFRPVMWLSWGILGPSWAHLGLVLIGPSWEFLAVVLGSHPVPHDTFGVVWKPSWAFLGYLW